MIQMLEFHIVFGSPSGMYDLIGVILNEAHKTWKVISIKDIIKTGLFKSSV